MLKEVFLKGKCVTSKYFLRSRLKGCVWVAAATCHQRCPFLGAARSWAKPFWGPLTLSVAQGRQNH